MISPPEVVVSFQQSKSCIIVTLLCFIACVHAMANNKLNYQMIFQNYYYVNFISLQTYFVPNSFLPLVLGFIIDYMGANYIMLSFLVTIFIAQIFHLLSVKYTEGFEFVYVSSIFYSLCGEAFLIPLLLHVETWFQIGKMARNLNFIIAFVSLGKLVKALLITIMYYLYLPDEDKTTGQANLAATSDESHDFLLIQDITITVLIFIGILISWYLIYIHKKLSKLTGNQERSTSIFLAFRRNISKRLIILCIGSALLHSSCFMYYEMHSGLNDNYDNGLYVRIFYFLFTIVFLVSVLASYSIGKYLDMHGTRTSFLFLSGIFLLVGFVIMSIMDTLFDSNKLDTRFLFLVIVISHSFVGIGYALHYGSIYTCLPCLIERKSLGLGLGILLSIQNIFCFLFTLIAQSIDSDKKMEKLGQMSFNVYLFAAIATLLGVAFFIYLERIEQKEGKWLILRTTVNPPSNSFYNRLS